MVVFEDVDVAMLVERKLGGTRTAMLHIIRGANHKTFQEMHKEIRSVQTQPVPPDKEMAPWFRFCMLQPWPLPKPFIALMRAAARRDPMLAAAMGGTVGVTAVGMLAPGISDWG